MKPLLAALKATRGVRALAHVTGGGFPDNLPRVLPDGLGVELDLAAFAPPPVFGWLARDGRRRGAEMLRTFNCGFGMVAFVAAERGATRHAGARAPTALRRADRPARRAREGERVVMRGRLKL